MGPNILATPQNKREFHENRPSDNRNLITGVKEFIPLPPIFITQFRFNSVYKSSRNAAEQL